MHADAPDSPHLADPVGASDVEAPHRWWCRPNTWLAVVAVVHAAAPIVLLGAHWAFGIDETIYLSQLNRRVPADYFSAPRARGSTLIAAPVTLLSSSIAAVRTWVTLLSGLGLYLAFRPWLRLAAGATVPLAAAAFASLWSVTFYGFEVMPNEWVAYAVLGTCGCLLRFLIGGGGRRHLAVLVAAPAAAALLRPSDAVYAVAALAVAGLLVRAPGRRRIVAVAALAAGTAAGLAQWVIEAQTSFGGISSRIHLAQAEQGGSGPFWSLGAQARVLSGPLLCRDGCHPHPSHLSQAWWVVLGVLVVSAVVGAARGRDRVLVLAPVCVGVVVGAQYLLTVPYGAPRFLIPAYALLAIPAVLGARALVRLAPRGQESRVAGVLVAGLVLSSVLQVRILLHSVRPPLRRGLAAVATQARVLRDDGVRGTCLVRGVTSDSQLLSYALACRNGPLSVGEVRGLLHHGTAVVYLTRHSPAPAVGGTWRHVRLEHSPTDAWVDAGRRART